MISDSADLHFVRSADGLTGRNLVKNDLCFMWCGAQSNFGVKSGKVCYECKVSSLKGKVVIQGSGHEEIFSFLQLDQSHSEISHKNRKMKILSSLKDGLGANDGKRRGWFHLNAGETYCRNKVKSGYP